MTFMTSASGSAVHVVNQKLWFWIGQSNFNESNILKIQEIAVSSVWN